MQYSFTFHAYNGLSYTVVASRYSQARKHFLSTFSGFLTVVYNGGYHGTPVKNKTVIATIKLANSLAYQSCEFDEWDSSEAKAFLDAFESWSVNKLPGYDAAPWTIEDDEPAGPVGLVETMNAMKKAGRLIVVNVGDSK